MFWGGVHFSVIGSERGSGNAGTHALVIGKRDGVHGPAGLAKFFVDPLARVGLVQFDRACSSFALGSDSWAGGMNAASWNAGSAKVR